MFMVILFLPLLFFFYSFHIIKQLCPLIEYLRYSGPCKFIGVLLMISLVITLSRGFLCVLMCSLQMLSIGVDRVVDQVINPKAVRDFKPQIDRVICEYLGVDYDKWMDRQSTGTLFCA